MTTTTYIWTGNVSGDWNTASNWSPNGVPTYPDTAIDVITGLPFQDTAVIDGGMSVETIVGGAQGVLVTAYDLYVYGEQNLTNSVVLQGDFTIGDKFHVAPDGASITTTVTIAAGGDVTAYGLSFTDAHVNVAGGVVDDTGGATFDLSDVTVSAGGSLTIGTPTINGSGITDGSNSDVLTATDGGSVTIYGGVTVAGMNVTADDGAISVNGNYDDWGSGNDVSAQDGGEIFITGSAQD